ncbi:hypothetical protein [Anaplasma platys]|uniref:hypothetical protein n=1 Tax=Anaplasma platys TaxID=949 RepID=UPI00145DDEE9|nr:hypothetical protein [Anaplasma platys]
MRRTFTRKVRLRRFSYRYFREKTLVASSFTIFYDVHVVFLVGKGLLFLVLLGGFDLYFLTIFRPCFVE